MGYNNMIEDGNIFGANGYIFGGSNASNLTGVAINDTVFALRNIGVEEIIIDQVAYGFAANGTPFGTAQVMGLGLYKVENFAASAAGGQALTAIKKKSLLADIPAADYDCRIATTGGLTSDPSFTVTEPVDMAFGESNLSPVVSGLWRPFGLIPLTLQQNQGIVVTTAVAMGAAGVGRIWVCVDARRA